MNFDKQINEGLKKLEGSRRGLNSSDLYKLYERHPLNRVDLAADAYFIGVAVGARIERDRLKAK